MVVTDQYSADGTSAARAGFLASGLKFPLQADMSDSISTAAPSHSDDVRSHERYIRIRGARTHNLREVSTEIPWGKLIVVTGVSGSGKSSLAFDTLFAESQRRYLECVSVKTRGLLHQLPRADVDEITGLAPAISVDQRVHSVPQRSTLAVTTEIYDFLRLLYARGGMAHCPQCARPVERQSVDQIVNRTLQFAERTRLMILSPMVRSGKGAHREILERIVRLGFVRARIDGVLVDLANLPTLNPAVAHQIEAIVDRIVIKEGIAGRLRESIELACRESDGTCVISAEQNGQWEDRLFSTRFCCPTCDLSFPTPDPGTFSFHSPRGACRACQGMGIEGAAIEGEVTTFRRIPCQTCQGDRLQEFPRRVKFLNLTLPDFCRLSVHAALKVTTEWLHKLTQPDLLTQESRLVAERTLPDIHSRLKCLDDVGVGYLTLDRPTRTLSGGEFQRARLAACLSSRLFGAHFVLDEPTAGLHPRDTHRLLAALKQLRDDGGTVIVVEHDPQVMQAADWLLDLGPGAGADGGQLLFAGTPEDCRRKSDSPTGRFLRALDERQQVVSPEVQNAEPKPAEHVLKIIGARCHNLKNLTVEVPLNRLTGITGVSGSGKSSLVHGTLVPWLQAVLQHGRSPDVVAADTECEGIEGTEFIRRLVALDQTPAGRSSRSCLATLTPVWDEIRRLFAKTRDARARGLKSQSFSFNSGSGRCATCLGTGLRNIRMALLPHATVPCASCQGTRFSRMIRSIQFRQKSVADVLQMRVDEACSFFGEFQRLREILQTFCDVGLGYLPLGQPSTTFSGGESQRARMAAELAIPSTEHTLYVLDEPTSGLHASDIRMLTNHLRKLVGLGHSVLVIEHNEEVIRHCDWIINLGPDAAAGGGEITFIGPPWQRPRT